MQFAPEELASIRLDLSTAQAVIDKLECGWRAIEVRALAGGSKDVFEIGIADQPAVVLKAYGDEMNWRLPKEAYIAGLIGDAAGVPTPRWLLTDETKSLLPRRFALISKLEGAAMSGKSTTPEGAGLYRQMGGMLRALHDVRAPAFGYILGAGFLKRFETNLDYMTAAFAVKFHDFLQQGGDPELARSLEAKVAAGKSAIAGCERAVVCHNDIHPGNVLAVQDADGAWRISGLIDLENAMAGDPLFDLAKALDQVGFDDPPGRCPLLEGYGPLGRPDAETAIEVYRIYHKLEMRNWLLAKGGDAVGPAGLLRDLEDLAQG